MKTGVWAISVFLFVAWTVPALAINIRVREVRRTLLEQEMTFVYENVHAV
jgi:hypothetical protein